MNPYAILYWNVYQSVRTLLANGIEPVRILDRILPIVDADQPIDPDPPRTRAAGRTALADALAGRAAMPPV